MQLAANFSSFKRIDRDEALAKAYAYMAERHTLRQKEIAKAKTEKRDPKINDRQFNPLIATQATTGGGKSYYLDELGALHSSDLALCSDPETKSALQNTVTVAITYNAGSRFDHRADVRAEAGIALRALHRYCT